MGRTSLRTRAARATNSPASIIADRKEAVELMNPRLHTKLQQIEKGMSDARAENLRWYYSLGGIVRDIRDNPEQYVGTDGTSGLKLIERALSTQARTLRRAAAFCEAYSPADFERLVGLENTETHFQLHWGHVNYLLTVENVEQRWRFAADACSKMLSPPELHAYMKRRLGRDRGHGRRHTVPPTPRAQLRQMEQVTTTWNTKQAQVWDGDTVSVLTNLCEVAPDDVDQEFLDHLKATQAGFVEMAESAQKNAEKMARVIERVEKLLEKKRQAAEVETSAQANAGKRSRSIELEEGGTRRRRGAAAA